jgi:DNA polymerase sigma
LLKPLVLVLKSLVEAYDISDPYKGGISSYGLTLMVIALLQVDICLFSSQKEKRKSNKILDSYFLIFYIFMAKK